MSEREERGHREAADCESNGPIRGGKEAHLQVLCLGVDLLLAEHGHETTRELCCGSVPPRRDVLVVVRTLHRPKIVLIVEDIDRVLGSIAGAFPREVVPRGRVSDPWRDCIVCCPGVGSVVRLNVLLQSRVVVVPVTVPAMAVRCGGDIRRDGQCGGGELEEKDGRGKKIGVRGSERETSS